MEEFWKEEKKASIWREHKKTIKEVMTAILEADTYNPYRNLYLVVGLTWGIPIPLATWVLAAHLEGYALSPDGIFHLLHIQPVYLAMVAFPLPFTVFLAALGHVKHKRDRYIAALLHELEANVERLSSANEELRELDKLRDEFTSNITHELKTPLVTIRGYSEMLLGGELGEIDDTQRRSLKVILKNVVRLIELIDQILQFRRLGSAPLPRQVRPFHLRKLLADIEQNFKPTILENRFDFSVELPGQVILVVADRPRIERVFTNLVSNALKFTPPEGRIWITVSEPMDGFVEISVSDSGCGIPKHAQSYVFDRFRQKDGSVRRRFGGTGLGLAIVKRILQAHGVGIALESEVEKGTTFRFRLPVAGGTGRVVDGFRETDRLRIQGRSETW